MGYLKVKASSTDLRGKFLDEKIGSADGSITWTLTGGGTANEKWDGSAIGGGGTGLRQLLCPEMFLPNALYGLVILGDGTGAVLNSQYASSAAAQAALSLGAAYIAASSDWANITFDFICSYIAIQQQAAGGYQSEVHWGLYDQTNPGGGFHYVMGTQDKFDNLPTGQGWYKYDFHGAILDFDNGTGVGLNSFESIPDDQAEAEVWVLRHFVFCNGTIGNNDALPSDGSTCFKIGASTSPVFDNLVVSGFDTQWNLAFCLQNNFINTASVSPIRIGIKLTTGADADFAWTDASVSNSASNGGYWRNVVCYGKYDMTSQIEVYDSSDIMVVNLVLQGPTSAPDPGEAYCENGFLYDNNSTVSKGLLVNGCHVEWGYNTSIFNHIDREGRMFVHYLYNQTQGLDAVINRVVLKAEQTAGKCGFVCHQWYDSAPANMQFECNNDNNCYFDFDCPYIAGNPQTSGDLQAAALWATANIPIAALLRIKPPLL